MMRASVHLSGEDENGSYEGTGFFVTVRSEAIAGKRYGYVITANHVIDGLDVVWLQAPNAHTGELYPPMQIDGWRQPLPGVDLALAALPDPPVGDYSAIEMEEQLMPNEQIAAPQLGAPILYVGLFAPARCLMARSGTLGAYNVTSIPNYPYPVHLVDCRSYGGFSGSPCWALLTYAGLEPTEVAVQPPPEAQWPSVGSMHYVAMLCGMFVAHYSDENDSELNPDGAISRYGVGVMVRGHEIRSALLTPDLVDARRSLDEAAKA